jgi:hypothetical protein
LIRSCSLVACKLLRSTTQTRSFSDYIYMCIGVSFLIYIETNAELLYCTSLFLLFMDREREESASFSLSLFYIWSYRRSSEAPLPSK